MDRSGDRLIRPGNRSSDSGNVYSTRGTALSAGGRSYPNPGNALSDLGTGLSDRVIVLSSNAHRAYAYALAGRADEAARDRGIALRLLPPFPMYDEIAAAADLRQFLESRFAPAPPSDF